MIQLTASAMQTAPTNNPRIKPYNSDIWGAVTLQVGDRIYGGWPGQTEFYTDIETIQAYASTPVALWAALQVQPSMQFGRRMQVAEYVVTVDVSVPAGRCLANTAFGSGGGFQFVVDAYHQVLQQTRVVDIHNGGCLAF